MQAKENRDGSDFRRAALPPDRKKRLAKIAPVPIYLFVIAESLPPSRMKRVREFRPKNESTRAVGSCFWSEPVPWAMASRTKGRRRSSFHRSSRAARNSRRAAALSRHDAVVSDPDRLWGTLESFLARLRGRMQALGARRVPFKGAAF